MQSVMADIEHNFMRCIKDVYRSSEIWENGQSKGIKVMFKQGRASCLEPERSKRSKRSRLGTG